MTNTLDVTVRPPGPSLQASVRIASPTKHSPYVSKACARFELSNGAVCRVQLRSEMPALTLLGGLFSLEECDALIELARPHVRPSQILDKSNNYVVSENVRVSDDMSIPRGTPGLVGELERRVAEIVNWPEDRATGFQVIRYRPGQDFTPHLDCSGPKGGEASHRVATLIVYLNSPLWGGSTRFVDAGIEVCPSAGQAVLFSYPSRRRSSMTMHEGTDVATGEKWIATKFFHG